MMLVRILALALASTLLAHSPASAQASGPSAATIKAHMAFLADDLLEGREAGTRGERLAARYIASEFESLGLKPAGGNGAYIQPVPLRRINTHPDRTRFYIEQDDQRISFENSEEFAVFGNDRVTNLAISGDLVFVGHGVTAPELGFDDYAELDVRGKIVVTLGGLIPGLGAAEAAHFGSPTEKARLAASQGAAGLIEIYTPRQEQGYAFANFVRRSSEQSMTLIPEDSQAPAGATGVQRMRITAKAAAALFRGSPMAVGEVLEKGIKGPIGSFPLKTRASLELVTEHDDTRRSGNVAGLLPGSDPSLADEYIVVTAHYDHVGICRGPEAVDRICNGAIDNALGTAAMMDVARHLASLPVAPARPILFLAVGAEEQGLLGSKYFVSHPTVGDGDIVANINMDGGLPYYQFSDVIAFGAEQSQLGEWLAAAITPMGLTVARDPFPEESIFTRSDQYSFVTEGIPALFLYNGFTDLDGNNTGRPIWDGSLGNNYHTPTDDLSLPIDYEVTAKYSKVFRRLVIHVANAPARPLWYEHSIFGKKFAPAAPKAQAPDPQ